MSLIDLHVHTTASDGTFSPEEVVEAALEKKLSVIAITDHDSVNGIDKAIKAAKDREIEIVSGVEITCAYEGREVHVLGYFIDFKNELFTKRLELARNGRVIRNEKIIALMQKDGIPVTLEKLKFGNEDTVVNRAHFARFLVEEGYVKNHEEAFKKYLREGCLYYQEREYIDAETAVMWIHEAGGKAFLAHPYLYGLSESGVRNLIKNFKKIGGDGVEVYHSSVNPGQSNMLREYAKENNLMVSGGSDFHGANKSYVHLGTGKGNLRVTSYVYDNILKGLL